MKPVLTAGWALTVLRDRGLPLPDHGLLASALATLMQPTKDELAQTLLLTQRGSSSQEILERAATIGRSLCARTLSDLTGVGITTHPATLLGWSLSTPQWQETIRSAIDGHESSVAALRRALPPPPDAGVAEASDDSPASPTQYAVEHSALRAPNDKHGDEGRAERKGLGSHRVYGSTGALTIEVDIARGAQGSARQYTLRFEAASSRAKGVYGWEEKIIVQLTRRELHQAAAVLLGLTRVCVFKGHGVEKDKRLELKLQPGGVFVRIGQGRRVIPVPIGVDDLYEVALLAVRALSMNDPDLERGVLLDILRLTASASAAPNEWEPTPPG